MSAVANMQRTFITPTSSAGSEDITQMRSYPLRLPNGRTVSVFLPEGTKYKVEGNERLRTGKTEFERMLSIMTPLLIDGTSGVSLSKDGKVFVQVTSAAVATSNTDESVRKATRKVTTMAKLWLQSGGNIQKQFAELREKCMTFGGTVAFRTDNSVILQAQEGPYILGTKYIHQDDVLLEIHISMPASIGTDHVVQLLKKINLAPSSTVQVIRPKL